MLVELVLNEAKNWKYMAVKSFLNQYGKFDDNKDFTSLKTIAVEILLDQVFEQRMAEILGYDRNRRRRETAKLLHEVYYGQKVESYKETTEVRELYNLLRESWSVKRLVEYVKKKDKFKERIKYQLGQLFTSD